MTTAVSRVTRWGAKLNTVDYMRDAVLFDGPQARAQYTRFWLLLTLSSTIAAVGVVTDSTATVIGAMIVAPLMKPIQGTMLSTILGDHSNLVRSVLVMIAGALAAVAIGFLVVMMVPFDVIADTNGQVAGRVSPGLLDLLAALATGIVASIALLRSDISDTLPGVAIAISLVPPLCVAGLTAEAGAWGESLGALLLFVTNVAAILATGSVVMAVYGFSKLHIELAEDKEAECRHRARAYLTTAVMVLIVAGPLTYSTAKAVQSQSRIDAVTSYVNGVVEGTRWSVDSIEAREGDTVYVTIKGEPPLPDVAQLYADMEAAGIDSDLVRLEFVPSYSFDSDGPVSTP